MTAVYAFIEAEKTTHTIALLCRLLKVARSSFYAWRSGEQARRARQAADDALAHEITVLHIASRHTYGVPRIHADLRRLGRRVNRKRVERVMRERGITGVTRRRRRSLTRPAKRAVPAVDLLGRDFTAPAPGTRLAGDITFIATDEGWLYLATWLPARSSATRWPTTTGQAWSSTRWRWPPAAAGSRPAASHTPTAARSTHPKNYGEQ
ncbi:IS3 family transposase [Streptomyces sp. NPDC004976]